MKHLLVIILLAPIVNALGQTQDIFVSNNNARQQKFP